MVISGESCSIVSYLEQVSLANAFPYKVIRRTEDEYIARFT